MKSTPQLSRLIPLLLATASPPTSAAAPPSPSTAADAKRHAVVTGSVGTNAITPAEDRTADVVPLAMGFGPIPKPPPPPPGPIG